jgi:hypothetical protein
MGALKSVASFLDQERTTSLFFTDSRVRSLAYFVLSLSKSPGLKLVSTGLPY